VVGLGGTALATSSSGGGNSFLDDVAHRLGISPAKLQNAIKGAQADQLNNLVKQGRVTRAQANAIEKRLRQRNGAPFGGFRHHGFRGGPRPFFGFGPMGPFATAASYLGITQDALGKDLRAGKTLAAIAKANGKSVAGLETAMLAPAKTHLDSAVKSGRLTKTQERRFLKMLSGGIDRLVTKGFRFGGPMHHGWDGHDGMQNGAKSAPTAFGL
jgi:predicted DNA-binding protein (UPF0251 family)